MSVEIKAKDLTSIYQTITTQLAEKQGTGLSYAIGKTVKNIETFLKTQEEVANEIHKKFSNKDENGKEIFYKLRIIEGRPVGLELDEEGNPIVAKEGEPAASYVKPEVTEYFDAKKELEEEVFTEMYQVSLKAQLEKVPDLLVKLDGVNMSVLLGTFFIDDIE